jgi:ribosome-associated heat shock protein Hsp15
VRIDRYLFFIRLLKSRTLAQGLIDAGHVRIDGRRVQKSSEEVRVGSVIALPLHDKVRVLRVLALPQRRGPAPEARACYQELGVDDSGRAS